VLLLRRKLLLLLLVVAATERRRQSNSHAAAPADSGCHYSMCKSHFLNHSVEGAADAVPLHQWWPVMMRMGWHRPFMSMCGSLRGCQKDARLLQLQRLLVVAAAAERRLLDGAAGAAAINLCTLCIVVWAGRTMVECVSE
jgi:hypothetical protein